MTYEKPQIARVGSATCAIQGTKPFGGHADMSPTRSQTAFAYEADE